MTAARTAAALIVVAGLLHVATLDGDHDWGGDFAMYVLHARNLAEGRSYADTGYVYNPGNFIGPEAYPPVLPLLLAPVHRLRGPDLHAMKLVVTACLLIALWLIFRLAARELPLPWAAALVGILAFNPYLHEATDHVMADLPFLAFTMLTLLLARETERPWGRRVPLLVGVAIGVAAWLASGTRSIGIVLVPAIALADLVRWRTLRPAIAVAGLVVGAGMALQSVLLATTSGYLEHLTARPEVILHNLLTYARLLSVVWNDGRHDAIRGGVHLVASLLALRGWTARVARGPGVLEIFPIVYLIPLVVFLPSGWSDTRFLTLPRYLIPVLPLYVLFALDGLRRTVASLGSRARHATLTLLVVGLAGLYASRYTGRPPEPPESGIAAAPAQDLFRWVRDTTAPDDVLLFSKPRPLALFTDRRAATFNVEEDDAALWAFADRVGARWLIAGQRDDPPYLAAFVERHPRRLSLAYRNAAFRVYRIRGPGPVP